MKTWQHYSIFHIIINKKKTLVADLFEFSFLISFKRKSLFLLLEKLKKIKKIVRL